MQSWPVSVVDGWQTAAVGVQGLYASLELLLAGQSECSYDLSSPWTADTT